MCNLASYLALRGQRTLLIDLDPQGNATSGLGLEKGCENNTYDLLINRVPIENVQHETSIANLYVCPGTIDLAGAEIEMVSLPNRESILKETLSALNANMNTY